MHDHASARRTNVQKMMASLMFALVSLDTFHCSMYCSFTVLRRYCKDSGKVSCVYRTCAEPELWSSITTRPKAFLSRRCRLLPGGTSHSGCLRGLAQETLQTKLPWHHSKLPLQWLVGARWGRSPPGWCRPAHRTATWRVRVWSSLDARALLWFFASSAGARYHFGDVATSS